MNLDDGSCPEIYSSGKGDGNEQDENHEDDVGTRPSERSSFTEDTHIINFAAVKEEVAVADRKDNHVESDQEDPPSLVPNEGDNNSSDFGDRSDKSSLESSSRPDIPNPAHLSTLKSEERVENVQVNAIPNTTAVPENADRAEEENREAESIQTPSPRPYNLRENRKRSYHSAALDQEANEEGDSDNYANSDIPTQTSDDDTGSSFSSSDSDTSINGDQEGDDDTTFGSESSNSSNKNGRSGNINPGTTSEHKPFHCELDGCSRTWTEEGKFRAHKILHAPGQYKCSFCDTVEENIARVCNHEKNNHQNPKSHSNDKISCPRCPLEWKYYGRFLWHFALAHIDGFQKELKQQGETCSTNTMRCEICNLRILKSWKEKHFNEYHDTSGMNPDEVLKCDHVNCTAYFKTNAQRYIHVCNEHKVGPANYGDCDRDISDKTLSCSVDQSRQMFAAVKDLKSHQNLHGTFKSKFCDHVNDFAPDLALHETEHALRGSVKKSKSGSFNCPRCPLSFQLKGRYIRHHVEKHLQISSSVSHVCPICNATGIGGHKFQKIHYKICHDTDGMDPAEIQRCDQCPAYFVKSDQLIKHKFHEHYKKKCPVCGKLFATRPSDFREHVEKRHPLVNLFPHLIYACDMKNCARRFGTERELERHKKNGAHYGDEMMQCSKCENEYKGEEKLRAHMNMAHPDLDHSRVCPECGKKFKSKHTLQIHMEYHKGPEAWKFECSTCGKKCADKHKLASHMRTHTKEKPFVCQFCGERYAHRHNWLGHMRTKHEDEFNELEHAPGGKAKLGGNFLSRKGSKKGDCITAGTKQK